MTTLQKTIITATISAIVGIGIYGARQISTLRGQNRLLQQQQTVLAEQVRQWQHQRDDAANRLVAQGDKTGPAHSLNSDRLRELLKLRGEVGVLRQQVRAFRATAAAATNEPGLVAKPSPAAVPTTQNPAPFQLQLVADEPDENSETVTNYDGNHGVETLNLQKTPLMDAVAISSATVNVDSATGQPQIDIEFSEVGKELFAAITRENVNKRLAIVLDGQIYSAPLITSEISDGKAMVTGSFTEDEARTLAAKISEAIQPKQ